ncbi:MAG: hypothetical protein ACT4QB_13650 [Gammaproteobacteria bacterium]
MYDEINKQWKGQGEAAIGALREIGEIHGRLLEGIKDQQFDLWELWRETAVKGTRLCTDAKDYKAVSEALPPLVKDYQQELLAVTGGSRDLMSAWNAEVGAWFAKQINTIQKTGAPIPA